MKDFGEKIDNNDMVDAKTDDVDSGKRSLLKTAGWAVPVVLTVALPRNVIAGSFFNEGSSKDVNADTITGEGTNADNQHDKIKHLGD